MTIEERVFDVLKNTFELDTVDATCSQKTCEKWDSMGHLNLVVDLETEFDVLLEPEDIVDMVAYDDIVSIIKSKVG